MGAPKNSFASLIPFQAVSFQVLACCIGFIETERPQKYHALLIILLRHTSMNF